MQPRTATAPIAVTSGAVREHTAAGVAAHRVIFIDLARALAVFLMVQGHTLNAVLAPAYRQGWVYDAWLFQRGLTSCLFLLLSGFAFSVATSRRWQTPAAQPARVWRRVRRFAGFVALGYALHFPVHSVAALATATSERWRTFLVVDVLQVIGVTFLLVQGLVMLARTRRAFAMATLVLCVAVVAATPFAWRTDWLRVVPLPLAAYLSPATGSLFPLFPWAAYILLGAALGQLYARWGASDLGAFTARVLVPAGGAMLAASAIGYRLPFAPFGPTDPWTTSPNQFLLRAGTVLLLLGAMAFVSRRISRLPHLFGAVAQESLLVYFVHNCLVYGSIWNDGLWQRYGRTLAPPAAMAMVGLLVVAMIGLAYQWNWCKHARPRAARVLAGSALAWLAWRLV